MLWEAAAAAMTGGGGDSAAMENGAALLCWAPGGNALVLALGGKLHALYDKPVTQAQAQAQARSAGAAGGGADAAAAAEAAQLPLAEWGRLCSPKDWQQLTQPQLQQFPQQQIAPQQLPLYQKTLKPQPNRDVSDVGQ